MLYKKKTDHVLHQTRYQDQNIKKQHIICTYLTSLRFDRAKKETDKNIVRTPLKTYIII